MARALAALGRSDEAIALAQEEVALLRAWGAPTALGPSLRLLGELRGADGHGATSARPSRSSRARRAVLEEARAQLALGRSRGDRSPGGGAPPAGGARHRPGLRGPSARPRHGVGSAASGARAAQRWTTEQTRVTSRQRRVIDLAATGLDVHEVAQRLFLTPGTVRAVLESARGTR